MDLQQNPYRYYGPVNCTRPSLRSTLSSSQIDILAALSRPPESPFAASLLKNPNTNPKQQPSNPVRMPGDPSSLSLRPTPPRSWTGSDISIDSVLSQSDSSICSTSSISALYPLRSGNGNAKRALIDQRRALSAAVQHPSDRRLKPSASVDSLRASTALRPSVLSARDRVPARKPYWSHDSKAAMAPYLRAGGSISELAMEEGKAHAGLCHPALTGSEHPSRSKVVASQVDDLVPTSKPQAENKARRGLFSKRSGWKINGSAAAR